MAIFRPDVKLRWYQKVFNYLAPLDNSKNLRAGAMGIHVGRLLPWIVAAAVTHDENDDLIREKKKDMTYRENDLEFMATITVSEAAYPFKNAVSRKFGHLLGKCVWPVIRAYREMRGENLVDAQILAARALKS